MWRSRSVYSTAAGCIWFLIYGSNLYGIEVEGRLRLQEIAESGTTSVKLCLNTALLWIRDPHNSVCPSSLHFRLQLPATFTYEDKTYVRFALFTCYHRLITLQPLPPTYSAKLSGLPGFNANIEVRVGCALIYVPV